MTHAMDRASARTYDLQNWFEVTDNPISKEGIFPYSGAQVGSPERDRIFRVYRPADELAHPDTIASFRLLPLIDDHEMLGAGFTSTDDRPIAGVIGENIRVERGTMLANLKIYSDALAEKLKAGKTELSCGYRCVYDFTPGFWNGQPYDVVQRQIRGNHIALVDEGRMGPDVRVLDHMIFTADGKEISPVDEEMKKMLADLAARIAKLEAGEVGEKPAGDEDMTASKAEEKPVEDMDKPAGDPPAEDMDKPGEKAKDGDYEAKAMDALSKQIKALVAKVDALSAKPVMDEAALVATTARKTALAARIAQHVGVFDHSGMTLSQIEKYGVEKLGLKNIPAGQEAVALDAALQSRQIPQAAAMDHARTASPLAASVAAYATKK